MVCSDSTVPLALHFNRNRTDQDVFSSAKNLATSVTVWQASSTFPQRGHLSRVPSRHDANNQEIPTIAGGDLPDDRRLKLIWRIHSAPAGSLTKARIGLPDRTASSMNRTRVTDQMRSCSSV